MYIFPEPLFGYRNNMVAYVHLFGRSLSIYVARNNTCHLCASAMSASMCDLGMQNVRMGNKGVQPMLNN